MCWFGDRIARQVSLMYKMPLGIKSKRNKIFNFQNELLSQEAFYQDWLIYPKDITNSLKLIILESRRPIALSAFSIMPLNIKTFEQVMQTSLKLLRFNTKTLQKKNYFQILKACYSFFMFIRDSNRKSFKEIDNKII